MKNWMVNGLFSHDLMVEVMLDLYPNLKHGVDYMVAHPVNPRDPSDHGPPFFMHWKAPGVDEPDSEDIKAKFEADEAKYRAAFARRFRNACLDGTDGKGNVSDAPAGSKAALQADAWRTYRQALRDVPQQAGFPMDIDWPLAPGQEGV
ncbi:phage tail assembly chaperone [Paraburkholderia sp. BL8N3]|nr:phage tail assembly chaperone [Paraburkholderia sp. BL8N3]TCK37963.1 phage tail assembly chaperone [Paraburkholderia sp. BL8N3]